MMCLQLGETFGFKIQGAVKWVLQTQNSLLFKYNEPHKIFVPPLVSKGLLRPCITTKNIPILLILKSKTFQI